MKIVHFASAETCEPDPGWKRTSLAAGRDVSVEHFVKPPGHASPLHEHPQAQVCIVLKGRMKAICETGEVLLEAGDAAAFEGGEPHAVENASDGPSVGLDVFVPGRSFDFWFERASAKDAR
jgi:quercetin dioxygenase-like cupin family protein